MFERAPHRTHNPLVADLIKSGRVGLVDSHALDLSIDELVTARSVSLPYARKCLSVGAVHRYRGWSPRRPAA